VLEVEELAVHFTTDDGLVRAVDGVSFCVDRGRTLGLVGESGSGKSVTAMTVMGLTRAPNARISGRIRLDGRDVSDLGGEDLRRLRGRDVAMIFQDPMSSLHPFFPVGRQLAEAVRAHDRVPRRAARERAIRLLELVGIPDPERRVRDYPHEFSGGMRQRVMIAMALINRPKVLIADEPTTALDVTVQAQILKLIRRLQTELDTAVLLITHDLGVVARVADDVAVMYAGRIVEHAPTGELFREPRHPYTWGLLGSIPRLGDHRDRALEPVHGSPPSLIAKPSGCAFHPRCPYVLPRHRQVDPALAHVDGSADHRAACLLSADTRRRLWDELRAGRSFGEAREAVELREALEVRSGP
jgi:peptide/nickel transport system ATP-binding protein